MSKEEIINWIREYISNMLRIPQSRIRNDVSIVRYGMDSLTVAGLLGDLSELLQSDLDIEEFESYPTIEGLAEKVCLLMKENHA